MKSLAIPQLQEVVEELLGAAKLSYNSDEAEHVESSDDNMNKLQTEQLVMTKELSDRLLEETETKRRLEMKLEQVVQAHTETQADCQVRKQKSNT